jgi:hypothetical protein
LETNAFFMVAKRTTKIASLKTKRRSPERRNSSAQSTKLVAYDPNPHRFSQQIAIVAGAIENAGSLIDDALAEISFEHRVQGKVAFLAPARAAKQDVPRCHFHNTHCLKKETRQLLRQVEKAIQTHVLRRSLWLDGRRRRHAGLWIVWCADQE